MARILIIDDEEPIRKVFRELMKESGHEVQEAENGYEGVWLCRKEQIDLVFVDMLMPKNGLEVIRELQSDLPHIKIVAITGYDPDLLSKAKGLGASHSLAKPFTTQDLLGVVNDLV